MAELIDPAVRLNMRIFKALEGMMDSRLAATIPFGELRQFVEAFLAADGYGVGACAGSCCDCGKGCAAAGVRVADGNPTDPKDAHGT